MGRVGLCAMLGLAAALVLAAPVRAQQAADTVETLHAALIDTMREAKTLGFDGRVKKLDPVVRRAYDFPFISRLVLSRHWRKLSEEQRRTMIEAFSAFTVATYADRFDGYDGESFRTLDTRPMKRGRRLVKTELVQSDGDTVSLDYLLQPVDGQWRIVNVVADGISDLSLKRAEYTSVVKNDGFDALIARLRAKVQEYAAGS